MAAAQRLATATSIDLAVARSHADKRTPAQTPIQRTITIGAAGTRGLRTYVQLFAVIASANDVRCDVASNSTFVYAYGFVEDIDATPRVVCQPGGPDGARVGRLHLVGRTPAHPDDHRPAEFSAGVRRPGWPAAGRGPRADPARSEEGSPSPAGNRHRSAEQGNRTSRLLPAARPRRGAPGRPAGLLRGIRRRRGGRGTEPASGRGWAAAPSSPGRGARWSGERRGIGCARLAAFEGLCRRGIRPDAVRPRRRTRLTQRGVSSARS